MSESVFEHVSYLRRYDELGRRRPNSNGSRLSPALTKREVQRLHSTKCANTRAAALWQIKEVKKRTAEREFAKMCIMKEREERDASNTVLEERRRSIGEPKRETSETKMSFEERRRSIGEPKGETSETKMADRRYAGTEDASAVAEAKARLYSAAMPEGVLSPGGAEVGDIWCRAAGCFGMTSRGDDNNSDVGITEDTSAGNAKKSKVKGGSQKKDESPKGQTKKMSKQQMAPKESHSKTERVGKGKSGTPLMTSTGKSPEANFGKTPVLIMWREKSNGTIQGRDSLTLERARTAKIVRGIIAAGQTVEDRDGNTYYLS